MVNMTPESSLSTWPTRQRRLTPEEKQTEHYQAARVYLKHWKIANQLGLENPHNPEIDWLLKYSRKIGLLFSVFAEKYQTESPGLYQEISELYHGLATIQQQRTLARAEASRVTLSTQAHILREARDPRLFPPEDSKTKNPERIR
jgi:vacuolar-type H+-ATPase catalytic subunit A/Vma1